ncbi:DUF4226 domain-containing protein [Mycolicibacter sp. MYC123]|uniref:DUF4226 domain-containing protein n=1 Tax=[Mycobacterium] zoologicum TaxID=2872311 RepID=A0ABU5YLW8_9MYCO|nr:MULTISPECIES: DUF4226 domain-containing protein [unclassified Mycolicibacter]MEB3051058.1 DUF4226 domain-containing protein [Mycolicibacter sp. MYC123]MEB3064187.1 DUF4226 domain-containing protein [Mycolicibacter sp. MYC101]
MPDERGEFADAARKREAQLAQRLAASMAVDQQFEAVLRGAVQHNRDSRQRLDAIESEVKEAAATWPGLDTPAGARQFQQFLIGKTREIYRVVADGLADSRARAATVRMLGGRYRIDADRTVHLAGFGRPMSPAFDRPADQTAFEDLLRANDQAVIDAMAQVQAAQKALDDAAAKAYAHGAGSDDAREAMARLPALKKNLADALDRLGKIPDYSKIDPASVHLGPDGAVSFTYTLGGQKMAVTGTLKNGTGEIYDQGAGSGSSAYFTYKDGKLVGSRFLDPGRVTPDDALLQNVIFTAVGAGPAVSAGKAGVEAGWQGMRALFAREALEAGGGSATGLTADNVLSRAVTQAEIRAHAAADDLAAHHPGLHTPVTAEEHLPPPVTHEHSLPDAGPHIPHLPSEPAVSWPAFTLDNPLDHMSPELRVLSEQHLTGSGETVLGPFTPIDGGLSYMKFAEQRGASYFNIGDAWYTVTETQRMAANQHVLDIAITNNDVITLSVPFRDVEASTYTAAEIRYLEANGYRRTGENTLIPPNKGAVQ